MLALLLACTDPEPGTSGTDSATDTAAIDTAPPCEPGVDSDGDGLTDCEELACVSDPEDPEELCYACGWPHGDPGTLEASGDGLGDTIENLTLYDACGESPKLWDFAGHWNLLIITTSWCDPCVEELRGIEEHRAEAREETGVEDLDWLVVLYEDATTGPPLGEDAGAFSDYVGVTGIVPVLADPTQRTPEIVPWEGSLPGKCLLSPEMVIGFCWSGEHDDEALAWLAAK